MIGIVLFSLLLKIKRIKLHKKTAASAKRSNGSVLRDWNISLSFIIELAIYQLQQDRTKIQIISCDPSSFSFHIGFEWAGGVGRRNWN